VINLFHLFLFDLLRLRICSSLFVFPVLLLFHFANLQPDQDLSNEPHKASTKVISNSVLGEKKESDLS